MLLMWRRLLMTYCVPQVLHQQRKTTMGLASHHLFFFPHPPSLLPSSLANSLSLPSTPTFHPLHNNPKKKRKKKKKENEEEQPNEGRRKKFLEKQKKPTKKNAYSFRPSDCCAEVTCSQEQGERYFKGSHQEVSTRWWAERQCSTQQPHQRCTPQRPGCGIHYPGKEHCSIQSGQVQAGGEAQTQEEISPEEEKTNEEEEEEGGDQKIFQEEEGDQTESEAQD